MAGTTDKAKIIPMAAVKQDLRGSLAAAGLLVKIGEDRVFMTLPTALEASDLRGSLAGRDWSR